MPISPARFRASSQPDPQFVEKLMGQVQRIRQVPEQEAALREKEQLLAEKTEFDRGIKLLTTNPEAGKSYWNKKANLGGKFGKINKITSKGNFKLIESDDGTASRLNMDTGEILPVKGYKGKVKTLTVAAQAKNKEIDNARKRFLEFYRKGKRGEPYTDKTLKSALNRNPAMQLMYEKAIKAKQGEDPEFESFQDILYGGGAGQSDPLGIR